ncbi:cxxc-type zinc finger protein [Anaeramoeba flamelloides]|uniref:Cxxc-type zinc finger protein n=1 Tax=Anaeramoeba flamelloides TaxID=1746091 RepID=A0ABQ8XBZ4_9EUKA|nr:cxxc-type zinc finger protein [Anaeramoeba flamelloides]
MDILIRKRTLDNLEPLSSEFSSLNCQLQQKQKARRLAKTQLPQTNLGTVHYKKNLLGEIKTTLGNELMKSLNSLYLTVYVPPSLATRENTEVKKRNVYGSDMYMLRSDAFAIAIHSEKFTPETDKTNGLGIFVKLRFCEGYHSPANQSLKKRNGISPKFCLPAKGIMVLVEGCTSVENIQQIGNLDQIETIKEKLLQTIQNSQLKKNQSKEEEKEKEKKKEKEKEKEKEKLIGIENIKQFQKSKPKAQEIYAQNPKLNEKKSPISVHKVCFTLSNDPCLSYEFGEVFQQKDQLFKTLQTQVLYLETRNQRFELTSNFKGGYQLSKVKNPLSQPQRRMKFQKNVPMRKTHTQIIRDNLQWKSIKFVKKFAHFDDFKISPQKFYFMGVLKK